MIAAGSDPLVKRDETEVSPWTRQRRRRYCALLVCQGHLSDGRIGCKGNKTENNGVEFDILIHPEPRRVPGALPADQFTVPATRAEKGRLPNGSGTPSAPGADQAKLPNGTSHGPRKAIARRLGAGATSHEIMFLTGHTTLAKVTCHTRGANRGNLETAAIAKIR